MSEGKKKQTANPHKDHRERVRRRFLTEGFDRLEDHVKLELLLFYAIPYRDTNPIAHALLEQFGSLSNVFEAPLEELVKTKGLGESGAVLLKMVPHLARTYLEDREKGKFRFYDTESAGKYLLQKYIGRTNETLTVVALDSKNRVLYCEAVYEGSIHAVPIHVKRIVEIAVRYNAASIVLAHNHPSGKTLPSRGDYDSTRLVYEALKSIDVDLLDHFILVDGDYISMASTGILAKILPDKTPDFQ